MPSKCNAVTISMGGAWATPGAYVYIHRLLHRLGSDTGNHYQLPSLAFGWVTDMPICGAVTVGVHTEVVGISIPLR